MRYVVTVSLHAAAVDQVGASAGDDVAAAHVHGDAHHAVRGQAAAGGGDHRGDVRPAALGVEIGAPAVLAVQLSLGVVGIGCSAGERRLVLAEARQNTLNCEGNLCSHEDSLICSGCSIKLHAIFGTSQQKVEVTWSLLQL